MTSKTLAAALTVFFGSFIFITTAFGQADLGRIWGSVTDANGAAVPGATITVTNTQTGEVRTTTSGTDGNFVIAALKPSTYDLSVESQIGVGTKFTIDLPR